MVSKQMPIMTLRPYCTDSQVVEVVHMHSEGVTSFEFLTLMVDIQGLPIRTCLGVDITKSKDLKWNQHVNKITASANRSLGFLRRNISFCSRKTKAIAFFTFVRPYLEYSSAVWDSYTDEQITQIEAVQRRGARFVFSDYSYESSPSAMIASLKWDSLALRRKEHRMIASPSRRKPSYTRLHALPGIPTQRTTSKLQPTKTA